MTADAQTTDSTDQPWTIGRLIKWTTEYLEKNGALSPRLDAEVLLAHVRECERIMLYTAFDEVASDDVRGAFRELVKRRAEGTPVAYLVGHKEFYSLRFDVTPDVLIPRPETEYLVMAALDFAKSMDGPIDVLDLGTGSGAVAVTVAHELPVSHVLATDISPAALQVASQNAQRHEVSDRIAFLESDLFTNFPPPVEGGEGTFDLILSNPPYISDAEMQQLPRDVASHEPQVALRGGQKGLEVSLRLIDDAVPRLRSNGAIALETSPMLASQLQATLNARPELQAADVTQDLSGLARIVAARKL